MQETIKNRTIFCRDNLDILQGMDSNSINLIYLDPPFNKKKVFTAPIGSSAEGASFSDIFRKEDIKDEWILSIKEDNDKLYTFLESVKKIETKSSYNFCYLSYMAIRLIEIHRVLKNTGSIYLHCDQTMSHYLKLLMDIIFGEKNFRNEIIWGYRTGGVSKKYFPRKHDIILYYGKTESTYYIPQEETLLYEKQFFLNKDSKVNKEGKYECKVNVRDVWDDELKPVINVSKERTGYPTQKPLKLLERIIKSSSKEGDVILDPFCGCATTCVASEALNRQWIGIDVSIKAYDLVQTRLNKKVRREGEDQKGQDDILDGKKEIYMTTEIPTRTDKEGSDNLKKKYVYVISNESYPNEYKVGIARDHKARLNSYQTSDPDRKYKLEYKIHTHLFRETEKHIHEKFENKHEWVRGDLETIIDEINNYKS